MRRPLAWVAAAFLLGIAARPILPLLAWWLLAAGALILAAVTLGRQSLQRRRSRPATAEAERARRPARGRASREPKPRWGGASGAGRIPPKQGMAQIALLVAILGLGALAAEQDRRLPPAHFWRVGAAARATLEGIVVSDPTWRAAPHRPTLQQAILAVTAVGAGADRRPASGRLWLRQSRPAYPWQYGDRLRIAGPVRPPQPARAPGGFDEQRWLWLQQVEGVVEPAREAVTWLGPAGGWRPAVRALLAAKHRALGAVRQGTDPTTAACLAALLVGDRTGLPRPVVQQFQDTGTIHLLSVSGWHVGVIGMLLWVLSRLVRLPRRGAAVATMLGLAAYCLLAGADPPIVRATLVGLLLLGGLCLARPADPLNSLAAAALLITAWSPRSLWAPAFQLSFGAVLALWWLVPVGLAITQPRLAGAPPWAQAPLAWLARAVVVPLAAWLGIWPLVAYHLHQVAPVTVLANLIAVPLAALVMVTGVVVFAGVGLHPWLVLPWVGAAQGGTHLLLAVLGWCRRWPGAVLPCPPLPWWGLLGWYAALWLGVHQISRMKSLSDSTVGT